MPNFKEFIKGFEEKPEAEQPKPAPKSDGWGGITQEPNRSIFAHTDEELRKMEAQRNGPKTYVKPEPKPVEQPQQGRMVYYQGKEMPFEEAKARSMGSYSIPKGYKPSEKEKKYMEKAAEYEVEEDDAFARWDHETDPDKKAELRKNMDNLGKEANAFLRELDKEPIDQPKTSNYRQWRSNPENAKREKEADAKYKPLYDELDKKDDELYKAYYYEQDPKKKAELKAQMDENDKKINALLDEWGKATGYPETPEEKRAWASLENMSQPKQGTFQETFGANDETYEANQRENAKEEGDLVYNEGETNDDYLKGLKIGDEVTIDGKVAQIVPPARVSSTRDKAGKVFFQYRVYPYRTGYIEKGEGEAIKPATDEERAQAKALDDQARKFGYSSFTDY